jgi:hypothetical protein
MSTPRNLVQKGCKNILPVQMSINLQNEAHILGDRMLVKHHRGEFLSDLHLQIREPAPMRPDLGMVYSVSDMRRVELPPTTKLCDNGTILVSVENVGGFETFTGGACSNGLSFAGCADNLLNGGRFLVFHPHSIEADFPRLTSLEDHDSNRTFVSRSHHRAFCIACARTSVLFWFSVLVNEILVRNQVGQLTLF